MHPDLGIGLGLEVSTRHPVRHHPGARTGGQRGRRSEIGPPRLRVARVEPDLDLAAQRPAGSEPAGHFQQVIEALARLLESAQAVQRDREAPQRLGRGRISVGRGLRGAPGILEMTEPPQRLRGEHERRDPDRGHRIVQVAMGHPQGPQRMIRAAARVFLQRLQRILGRFPALAAVFGRHTGRATVRRLLSAARVASKSRALAFAT